MENELYITDDCLIENEEYQIFKDYIKCELWKKILKEPILCKICQKTYCKVCIDKWKKNNNKKCPNNCEEPDYQISPEKQMMLSMLNYLCRNCGEEINYNDVESHLNSGCKTVSTLFGLTLRKKHLKKLSSDDEAKIKNEGYDINNLSSKQKMIYNLNNSYNSWKR